MPYNIVKYQRGNDRLAPKELKNVHPLGTAPVVVDGDITVVESGAIVGESSVGFSRGSLSEAVPSRQSIS